MVNSNDLVQVAFQFAVLTFWHLSLQGMLWCLEVCYGDWC